MNWKENKPKPTLAAWNTNVRVVSNRLNQNPALSLALISQSLILLPVLHSLFAASLAGVRLQEEIHLLGENIFPGPLSCRSEKQPEQELPAAGAALQVLLSCSKKECGRRGDLLLSFISPAVGVSGQGLALSLLLTQGASEGKKRKPCHGQGGWILNRDF